MRGRADGGRAKAVYLAWGINLRDEKALLGIWIAQTERAKFGLHVANERKNRGVHDIFLLASFRLILVFLRYNPQP